MNSSVEWLVAAGGCIAWLRRDAEIRQGIPPLLSMGLHRGKETIVDMRHPYRPGFERRSGSKPTRVALLVPVRQGMPMATVSCGLRPPGSLHSQRLTRRSLTNGRFRMLRPLT